MRIGEILLESGLIDSKQLADALYYAKAKALPLGRCLHILRSINEDNLRRSLEAQKLIRQGTPPPLALEALRSACQRNVTVHEALQDCIKRQGPNATYTMPQVAQMAPSGDTPPGDLIAVNRPGTRPPQELVAEADQFMLDDRVKDAEALYVQAQEQLVKVSGSMSEESAAVSLKIANLYLATDRYDEAEAIYRSLLGFHLKSKGDANQVVAKAYEDLGDLHQARNQKDLAHDFHRSAIRCIEKTADIDVAVAGRILRKLVETAPDIKEDVKRIGELCTESGLLTPQAVQTALQKSKQLGKPMGSILREENLLDAVQLESLLHAQLLMKENLAKPTLAVQALQIALRAKISLRQLCEAGRLVPPEADDDDYKQIVLEQDRLLTAETALGVDHVEVAQIASKLAQLQYKRKDNVSAELLLKRAVAVFEKSDMAGKQDALNALQTLAGILVEAKRYSEAQLYLFKALEIRQKTGRTSGPESLFCLRLLGKVESSQFNFASACGFYKSALALFDEIPETANGVDWHWMEDAANCFLEAGLVQDAEMLAQKFVFLAQRDYGPADPETASWMAKSAEFALQSGNVTKAEAQLQFALHILERSLDSAPQMAAIKEKLARLPNKT